MRYLAVILSLLLASPAYAASVSLRPYGAHHDYEDADDTFGIGVDAEVRDIHKDFVLFTGIEGVGAETELEDIGILDWHSGVGYDLTLLDGVTVTPKVAYNLFYVNTDGTGFEGTQNGVTPGVDVSIALNDTVSLVGGAGYTFSEESELNLDNFQAQAGIKIKL